MEFLLVWVWAEEDPSKKPDKKASGLLMHLEEINICYVYLRV